MVWQLFEPAPKPDWQIYEATSANNKTANKKARRRTPSSAPLARTHVKERPKDNQRSSRKARDREAPATRERAPAHPTNSTALYEAIEDASHTSDWTDIIRFLDTGYWPDENSVDAMSPKQQAMTWVTNTNGPNVDKSTATTQRCYWRRLPLHLALVCGAPFEVVARLVELYPTAVRYPDHQRMLPIHLALSHNAPIDTINYLLIQFPESIHSVGGMDDGGRTPVQMAAGTKHSEVLQFLAKKERNRLKAVHKANQRRNGAEIDHQQYLVNGEDTVLRMAGSVSSSGNKSKARMVPGEVESLRKIERLKYRNTGKEALLQRKIRGLDMSESSMQIDSESRDDDVSLRHDFPSDSSKTISLSSAPDVISRIKLDIQSIKDSRIRQDNAKREVVAADGTGSAFCKKIENASKEVVAAIQSTRSSTDADRLQKSEGSSRSSSSGTRCKQLPTLRERTRKVGKPSAPDRNALNCDYKRSCTPLYKTMETACAESEWRAIVQFLDMGTWPGGNRDSIDPKTQARTWVTAVESSRRSTVCWSRLPLHLSVTCGAPFAVVARVVELYPRAVRSTDDQGSLPIHLAFRHDASEETINYLLIQFPESARVRDRDGHTPAELARFLKKRCKMLDILNISNSLPNASATGNDEVEKEISRLQTCFEMENRMLQTCFSDFTEVGQGAGTGGSNALSRVHKRSKDMGCEDSTLRIMRLKGRKRDKESELRRKIDVLDPAASKTKALENHSSVESSRRKMSAHVKEDHKLTQQQQIERAREDGASETALSRNNDQRLLPAQTTSSKSPSLGVQNRCSRTDRASAEPVSSMDRKVAEDGSKSSKVGQDLAVLKKGLGRALKECDRNVTGDLSAIKKLLDSISVECLDKITNTDDWDLVEQELARLNEAFNSMAAANWGCISSQSTRTKSKDSVPALSRGSEVEPGKSALSSVLSSKKSIQSTRTEAEDSVSVPSKGSELDVSLKSKRSGKSASSSVPSSKKSTQSTRTEDTSVSAPSKGSALDVSLKSKRSGKSASSWMFASKSSQSTRTKDKDSVLVPFTGSELDASRKSKRSGKSASSTVFSSKKSSQSTRTEDNSVSVPSKGSVLDVSLKSKRSGKSASSSMFASKSSQSTRTKHKDSQSVRDPSTGSELDVSLKSKRSGKSASSSVLSSKKSSQSTRTEDKNSVSVPSKGSELDVSLKSKLSGKSASSSMYSLKKSSQSTETEVKDSVSALSKGSELDISRKSKRSGKSASSSVFSSKKSCQSTRTEDKDSQSVSVPSTGSELDVSLKPERSGKSALSSVSSAKKTTQSTRTKDKDSVSVPCKGLELDVSLKSKRSGKLTSSSVSSSKKSSQSTGIEDQNSVSVSSKGSELDVSLKSKRFGKSASSSVFSSKTEAPTTETAPVPDAPFESLSSPNQSIEEESVESSSVSRGRTITSKQSFVSTVQSVLPSSSGTRRIRSTKSEDKNTLRTKTVETSSSSARSSEYASRSIRSRDPITRGASGGNGMLRSDEVHSVPLDSGKSSLSSCQLAVKKTVSNPSGAKSGPLSCAARSDASYATSKGSKVVAKTAVTQSMSITSTAGAETVEPNFLSAMSSLSLESGKPRQSTVSSEPSGRLPKPGADAMREQAPNELEITPCPATDIALDLASNAHAIRTRSDSQAQSESSTLSTLSDIHSNPTKDSVPIALYTFVDSEDDEPHQGDGDPHNEEDKKTRPKPATSAAFKDVQITVEPETGCVEMHMVCPSKTSKKSCKRSGKDRGLAVAIDIQTSAKQQFFEQYVHNGGWKRLSRLSSNLAKRISPSPKSKQQFKNAIWSRKDPLPQSVLNRGPTLSGGTLHETPETVAHTNLEDSNRVCELETKDAEPNVELYLRKIQSAIEECEVTVKKRCSYECTTVDNSKKGAKTRSRDVKANSKPMGIAPYLQIASWPRNLKKAWKTFDAFEGKSSLKHIRWRPFGRANSEHSVQCSARTTRLHKDAAEKPLESRIEDRSVQSGRSNGPRVSDSKTTEGTNSLHSRTMVQGYHKEQPSQCSFGSEASLVTEDKNETIPLKCKGSRLQARNVTTARNCSKSRKPLQNSGPHRQKRKKNNISCRSARNVESAQQPALKIKTDEKKGEVAQEQQSKVAEEPRASAHVPEEMATSVLEVAIEDLFEERSSSPEAVRGVDSSKDVPLVTVELNEGRSVSDDGRSLSLDFNQDRKLASSTKPSGVACISEMSAADWLLCCPRALHCDVGAEESVRTESSWASGHSYSFSSTSTGILSAPLAPF